MSPSHVGGEAASAARTRPVGGDHQSALQALGAALQKAATVLRDEALRSPAAAFRAVAATDRALANAPVLLAALRPLIELGEPGSYVTSELKRHEEQLAELADQTEPYRSQLEVLLGSEARLQAAADKRDEIVARISELRRIEQLAANAAELRAQRDVLEARADAVARAAADADMGIALAAGELSTLADGLLETLGEESRDALRRAAEQDRLLRARLDERQATAQRIAADTARLQEELAAAQNEAADTESEFERAQTAISRRLAALTRYAAANRAINAALATQPSAEAGPARVGTAGPADALDEAEKQLAVADAALKQVLAEHQQLRQAARAALRPKTTNRPSSPEER